jgi:hypothetical protein
VSGPTGADVVRRLLQERRLQSVPADRAAAEALLEAAAGHLDSALIVADSDPDGAYTMLSTLLARAWPHSCKHRAARALSAPTRTSSRARR